MEKIDKKSFLQITDELNHAGIVFLCFFFTIVWGECILRFSYYKGLAGYSWIFVIFAIPEALLLTFLVGFFKNEIINKIILYLLVSLTTIYYGIQLVYNRIFGSYISASLFKMGGEALENFFWAMQDVVKKSVLYVLLLFIPLALIILFVKNRNCSIKYRIASHLIVLLSAFCGFSLIVWGIKNLEGTGRLSTLYYIQSPIVDTDSSSLKIGVMTTTIVEIYKNKTFMKADVKQTTIDEEKNGIITSELLGIAPPPLKDVDYNDLLLKEAELRNVVPAEGRDKNKIDYLNFNLGGESDELQKLSDFIETRMVTSKNEYSGIFEGYNLIYICAESFWTYAVDEQVTPVLYRMSNNGIVLDNYYNSFKNTTTNGEYAFVVSLWPDVSNYASGGRSVGSFSQSSEDYMPIGVGHVFNEIGYNTYASHNYYGFYYNRNKSYKNLGFQNISFMDDGVIEDGMTFSTDWITSDEEMMIQSVNKYIDKDHFFSYYMTFSGHGPYSNLNWICEKNIDEVKSRLGDRAGEYNEEALSYMAGNLEFEYAMEYLTEELEKHGILDKTIIVIAGDHYPYYLTESGRDSLAGRHLQESEIYKSDCIIYNSSLDSPIHSDKYCCNVDILPTVLNLMGVEYDSRILMGTDIFSDGIHKAVLYDLSFENDIVKYDRKNGQVTWKIDKNNFDTEYLDEYLEEMNTMIESEYSASVSIIRNDYFRYLWNNSGLMQD